MAHDPAYRQNIMTQRLAGAWYAENNQWSHEKLTLKPDGSCVQEVTFKKGRGSQTARGTWVYCPDQGVSRVCLRGNFIRPDQAWPKAASPARAAPGDSPEPPAEVFFLRYEYGNTYLVKPDNLHPNLDNELFYSYYTNPRIH